MTQKCIFFDLDGTITDSGEGIMNCAALALEHFGIAVPSREEMRVFVGPPLDQTFIRFGIPADKTSEAIEVFRSRYAPVGIFENHPYPGIREMLQTLRSQSHRLFIATSKPEEMANRVLDMFGLSAYFELICGADLKGGRSEKSQVIAYLLEISGGVENTVMVGDTAYDVIGASRHGIPTIGVSWGYGKETDMINAGAVAMVHTPEELLEYINQ